MLMMAAGCSSSDTWKTERYRDDAGHDIVVAKRRVKQDGIALTSAAKCTAPNRLSFEFFTPANFQVTQAGGHAGIAYNIAIDGRPAIARLAAFTIADTLIVDASLPASATGPAVDLRTTGRMNFQLLTTGGATHVPISLTDPGLGEVLAACGIDPSKSIALASGGTVLHRPAPSLLAQPAAGSVTLARLSATWACSGDLGNFNLLVAGAGYQFSDDSPWGKIRGPIKIGASEAGVDDSPTFPVALNGGPWDGGDSPWSYSPLAGGTIYYVAPDTGDSAQCTHA